MLVRRVVVQDQMHVDIGRHVGFDAFEKRQPFLMPMSRENRAAGSANHALVAAVRAARSIVCKNDALTFIDPVAGRRR